MPCERSNQPTRGPRRALAALTAAVGTCALAALLAVGSNRPGVAASPPPAFTFVPEGARVTARAAMVEIPAGRYPLGRSDGPRAERPAHAVDLDAFFIDRTEVTNAAFAAFLNDLDLAITGEAAAGRIEAADAAPEVMNLLREGNEGSGLYPIIALDDAQARIERAGNRFRATPGYEDHPVTETTWAGAAAFCRWRGARLPTEAEWEAAARGADGRLYPWGDDAPDATRVFTSGRTGVTAPVGSRPDGASPFGVLDMSGSLAEWTSTLRRPYPYDAADGREDPSRPGERVTRGGDYIYDDGRTALTATHRAGFSNAPERGHRHIGFRCAADAA